MDHGPYPWATQDASAAPQRWPPPRTACRRHAVEPLCRAAAASGCRPGPATRAVELPTRLCCRGPRPRPQRQADIRLPAGRLRAVHPHQAAAAAVAEDARTRSRTRTRPPVADEAAAAFRCEGRRRSAQCDGCQRRYRGGVLVHPCLRPIGATVAVQCVLALPEMGMERRRSCRRTSTSLHCPSAGSVP